MEVIITSDTKEMGKEGAKVIAEALRKKPNLVLGLATGSTPVALYKELIRMHKEEGLDFSKVTTFNLDEYLGLPPTHDQSYRYFMNTQLFDHINVSKEKTHVLSGIEKDSAAHCKSYEDQIKAAGGIDIQVLGIGGNGHIAFNEPGSAFDSRTRVVDLTQETIQANSDGRFFKDPKEVPTKALSMGMGTIMEAKKIILLANGAKKADAVSKSIEGTPTTDVPASVLQKHKEVVFVIEKEAATQLKKQYKMAGAAVK